MGEASTSGQPIRWRDIARWKKPAAYALGILWSVAVAFGGWVYRDWDKQRTLVAVNTTKIEKIESVTTGHTGQLVKIEDKTDRILFLLAGDRRAAAAPPPPTTLPAPTLTLDPDQTFRVDLGREFR